MIVSLITKSSIFSMTLPARTSGQYWLSDKDDSGRLRQALNAEGIQEHWTLRSGDTLDMVDEQGKCLDAFQLPSAGTCVISARYRESGEKAQIYVEQATTGRQTYQKYCVKGDCEFSIGRTDDNQITFDNQYVSGHHAKLLHKEDAWSVVDTQSRNGTFVNDRRTALAHLKPGDCIYIMGLKILIGGSFLAINNPDDALQIHTQALIPFIPQAESGPLKSAPHPQEKQFFRSPRFCKSITAEEIRVDAPPNREKVEEIPLALLLGPALTMGITALVMGAVAIINLTSGTSTVTSSMPTIVMSVSMLCGTVLWPLLTKKNEKKRKNVTEARRQAKYREYLDRIRDRLNSIAQMQEEILRENNPDVQECEKRILERRRNLWERSSEHTDFLRLRLGTGDIPMTVNLHFPDQRFALEDDSLLHDLARFEGEQKILSNVPTTFSLRNDPISGIVGSRKQRLEFAKSLLLQIAALHSANDVKMVFLIDEEDLPDWEFVKWLPHVWEDSGSTRFLATTEQEVRAMSVQLEHELGNRIEALDHSSSVLLPHYVLISASRRLTDKAEFFSQALKAPPKADFSCLALAETLRELPKECSKVIELDDEHACIYDNREMSEKRLTFHAETATGIDLTTAAKSLANLKADMHDSHFQLPSMVTFLEMYGVGKVEHLNALSRWRENNPVNSLQAPVGIGMDGEPFELDLHEKFQGPHGLVAGMTGSGKSEFIITYILSLSLNYSPDEVSFILIDYKGGGLAGAFENVERGIKLPHLAGTITNLDGAAVKRSLISIQSELRRRQAVFNEARRISGEGTIDIYKYQKMYRNGQVTKAVPHLFIISDEFAELKAQQPEFMEQLISAARIGRSLGIHLILATQKPNGVVDDQIWSNSRFRICLKVQERADSMDMIKRPDAAALAETGRFYLQIGFNELFALGQSAWSGAPYHPAERVVKKRDDRVTVLDHLGRVLSEAKPRTEQKKTGADRSQVVEIVDYLATLAAGEHLFTRQLWLPAIPAEIYVDALRKKYQLPADALTLAPVIGEYDDPFNQRQGPLTLPLTERGNVLIYGSAGSGKILLLNALLYDLLNHYDAGGLNLYLMDYGEESLRIFEAAPQVGGVLLSTDEERTVNLFKMLQDEVLKRRRLFADYGGDFKEYCRQSGKALPQIVVILHNYSAFAEQFEQMEESLLQLTRDGVKCGIYFVVTANSSGSIRYRITQNFKQTLVLQLNDRTDYVGLLGSTDGVYPSAVYGRGIYKEDRTYEFQTAHTHQPNGIESLRSFVSGLAENASVHAEAVPVLPERVDCSYLKGRVLLTAFPVGVEKESLHLRTLNLQEKVVTVFAASDAYELREPAQGMAEALAMLSEVSVTVLDGFGIFNENFRAPYHLIAGEFEAAVNELYNEMVRRNNTYKTAKQQHQPLPEYPLWAYEILGFSEILAQLSADGKDRLRTLIEKSESEYNVRFVICDTARGITALAGDGWYKKFVSGNDGIWCGDGVSDQYVLKIGKVSSNLYAELPSGFGYEIRRGRPTLVKLLSHREEDAE